MSGGSLLKGYKNSGILTASTLGGGGPAGFLRAKKTADLIEKQADKALKPVPDEAEQPGVPLLDDAQKRRDVSDRLRKRRGVLATLFGGQANTAPAVGQKLLTGS